METLDLFKDRKPYTVIMEVKGGKKEFKIPTELTVEESERLLEREIVVKEMMKEEVEEKNEKQKINQLLDNVFEYILILLQRYNPEMEKEHLKKMLSYAEAIRIFEFFKQQRFVHLLGLDGSDNDGAKKKLKQPKNN